MIFFSKGVNVNSHFKDKISAILIYQASKNNIYFSFPADRVKEVQLVGLKGL